MKGLSDYSPEKCLDAEASVAVENAVFPGNEGINHVLGKMVYADNLSFFFTGKLCNQLAVDVKYSRGECCIEFREVFVVDYVFSV